MIVSGVVLPDLIEPYKESGTRSILPMFFALLSLGVSIGWYLWGLAPVVDKVSKKVAQWVVSIAGRKSERPGG